MFKTRERPGLPLSPASLQCQTSRGRNRLPGPRRQCRESGVREATAPSESHRTETQLMRQLKGHSSSCTPHYPQCCLLWQKPSIKSQVTWELRQLKSQVPMGAGQREKQTEKQRTNLPDFQGFPRPRPGLLDVDSQQPEEFCWGNTVIGQLANGLKKDADVDWKVLQWADCSSGGGELLLSCKGQASPLYCGSEWDRVSGVGSGQG